MTKKKHSDPKPGTRKLGEPIPPALILRPNGTLAMIDGSDPAEYLKAWRRAKKIKGNFEVCVAGRKTMESLEADALTIRWCPLSA